MSVHAGQTADAQWSDKQRQHLWQMCVAGAKYVEGTWAIRTYPSKGALGATGPADEAGGPAHNSASSSIPAGGDAHQHCTQHLVRRCTAVT